MQLLVYIEEMQMQQRAENGIREIILGYVGHEDEALGDELDPEIDINELTAAFEGPMYKMSIDELPDDVRSVLLAENHRLTTGEVLRSKEFARKET